MSTAGLTLPALVPRSTIQADLRVHRVRRHEHQGVGLGGAAPRLRAVAAGEVDGAGAQRVSRAVRG